MATPKREATRCSRRTRFLIRSWDSILSCYAVLRRLSIKLDSLASFCPRMTAGTTNWIYCTVRKTPFEIHRSTVRPRIERWNTHNACTVLGGNQAENETTFETTVRIEAGSLERTMGPGLRDDRHESQPRRSAVILPAHRTISALFQIRCTIKVPAVPIPSIDPRCVSPGMSESTAN